MSIEFIPGVTSITFGGVDITPMIDTGKSIVMHFVDSEELFPSTFDMKPITLRLKGRATPQLYRMLFGRQHPRIRRMHSAYSRKRGRGRR
jgi:hypothetical protein